MFKFLMKQYPKETSMHKSKMLNILKIRPRIFENQHPKIILKTLLNSNPYEIY